jgi:hypothetical protein
MKPYWWGAVIFGAVFLVLFVDRIGLIDRYRFQRALPTARAEAVSERDTWMNVFQNNRKIGYSRATLVRGTDGLVMKQTLFMRVNTMGMIHEIQLNTEGWLNPDMTLSKFRFSLSSGRFDFTASGEVEANRLVVRTQSAQASRTVFVPLRSRPYLASGIYDAVWAAGAEPGTRRVVPVFDPATMGQEPVTVEVIGTEPLTVMGQTVQARKVAVEFKGVQQQAWLGEGGEVLRQEGFLGISMQKTDRQSALYGVPVEASQDLTEAVSIASNVVLDHPADLTKLRVKLTGIDADRLGIDGGRQRFDGGILTVEKESLSRLPDTLPAAALASLADPYLQPTPLIQSDHPRITELARKIAGGADTPLEVVRRLTEWIRSNIEPRPVISLPDALATLENRTGDCNEHAVLMAALSRAAGIPTGIEAGLVYLRGRFFYHAWNRVFIGRWITVDTLFGQIPADVTHLKLAEGSPEQQLDLMSVIGRVQLQVLAPEDAAATKTDGSVPKT